jgi:hypothetical protein
MTMKRWVNLNEKHRKPCEAMNLEAIGSANSLTPAAAADKGA